MDSFKNYVLTVVIAAILGALVMTFVPSNKGQQKLLKMICGLFLLLIVCLPLGGTRLAFETDSLEELRKKAQTVEEEAGEQVNEEMSEVIRQQVKAYIEDKAADLGAYISAEVTLNNELIPWTVELVGTAAPYIRSRLSREIAEELGIPKERQVWLS